MDDVMAAALTPELVVGLIELLRRLLRSTTKEQNDIKQNLIALRTDLGIIKDIVQTIDNYNSNDLDGVMGWKEQALGLVNDARTLLQGIEDRNNRPQKKRRNQERFHCSTKEAKQLSDLRSRCDQLAKHNETVLKLIEQHRRPFHWLLCGGCC